MKRNKTYPRPGRFISYGLMSVLMASAALTGEAVAQENSSQTSAKTADVASRPEYAVPVRKEKTRKRIGDILNQTTIDLIKLRRITKQVHWNVTGKHFYAVHDTTGDFAALLNDHIDTIAERALALGIPVDGRIPHINAASRLGDGPNGFNPDYSMARIMAIRLGKASELLTQSIDRLGKLDLVSQDMLVAAKADVDKYHWQFAVQLRELEGDGSDGDE